jgi:hypothetical protein
MDEITQKEFDKATEDLKEESDDEGIKELNESEFNTLLKEMQNPVQAQQRLAVQIKTFLDHSIKKEMNEKGFLSDHTRRWVGSYNNILEKIQKALYGDKSVNLHLHKVSHSDISTKIRESVFEIASEKKKKEKKEN